MNADARRALGASRRARGAPVSRDVLDYRGQVNSTRLALCVDLNGDTVNDVFAQKRLWYM